MKTNDKEKENTYYKALMALSLLRKLKIATTLEMAGISVYLGYHYKMEDKDDDK